MTEDDVESVALAQEASFNDLDQREGREPRAMKPEIWERLTVRLRHLLTHDPAGSWVATENDKTIGAALALKRDGLWGLSLLVVDPGAQSAGTGRKLLDASLTYAAGCERAIILSSADPRAMRCYATSGFEMFPQVQGQGIPHRDSLPPLHGRVREACAADAALGDDIDRAVRGAARGPDHPRLAGDSTMFVVDDVDGKGYGYVRGDGLVMAVAGTDDRTATDVLWRSLAHVGELGVAAMVHNMNAQQQWAISLCYQARLEVSPFGPVFWRNGTPPPAYLPSGAYL